MQAKSESDVIFFLQLLSKILTCTLHLASRESMDHLRIGLIHKGSIDYKSLTTL